MGDLVGFSFFPVRLRGRPLQGLQRQWASPPRPTVRGSEALYIRCAHHATTRDEIYSLSAATRNVLHCDGLGPAHFAYAHGLTLAILPCC